MILWTTLEFKSQSSIKRKCETDKGKIYRTDILLLCSKILRNVNVIFLIFYCFLFLTIKAMLYSIVI